MDEVAISAERTQEIAGRRLFGYVNPTPGERSHDEAILLARRVLPLETRVEIAEQRAATAEALCAGFDAERTRLLSQRDRAVTIAREALRLAALPDDGYAAATGDDVTTLRAALAALTGEAGDV